MVTKFVAHFMIFMLCLTKALVFAEAACLDKCGDVSIPPPFGIGPGCYTNEGFELTCANTSSPAKPFIAGLGLEVLEISLTYHTVRVNYPILLKNCYNEKQANITNSGNNLTGTPFSFSGSLNILTALGCNFTLMISYDDNTIVRCVSTCDSSSSENGQTTIPPPLKFFKASLRGIEGTKDDSLECKYAFLVDQEWFSNSSTNVSAVKDMEFVPAVLDWAVSGLCDSLGKNLSGTTNSSSPTPTCSTNALCYDEIDGNGSSVHFCYCRHGHEGNPYAPPGCQDINECDVSRFSNVCSNQTRCVNYDGGYSCYLRYEPYDIKPRSPIGLILGVSISVGVLLLLIFTTWLYKAIQRRKRTMLKKKFFKRNGGLLLEKQLASGEENVDKTKLFTSKELDKATDQYNEDRILGQGGQGTVYKGMLTDGRIVAVKKSKLVDEANLEQFINEVVILSQINHRNVVKLFGCCLETEVPMLVYEFIPKGTLLQYIHEKDEDFPFSWVARLRIACEVAGALFYLHSAASIPIYHRDIKSSNILLDDKYRAKVSDFGTSRSVATDKTHLTTIVQGTFGYLDPEYFQSSQFTEKSDVYSFGVVLVELFTGEKAISTVRSQEGRSLARYFIQSMMENRLFDIVDAQVAKEAPKEDIVAVANLAIRCLNLDGKNRPTMKEVAMALEGINSPQREGGDLTNLRNYEEFDYRNGAEIIAAPWDDASTSTGSCLDNSVSSSLDVQPLLLNRS